jgi:hypothetical protein
MDTSEPYHYAKAKHKLPNFLSFACKKSDLDSLLVSSTLNAPFKTLYFSKHGGLKKNKVDEKVLVALAHLEPDGPTLKIYSVPRGLAGIIRSLLKERGLPEIMSRLQDWNSKTETWRQTKHSFALWFYSKTSELVFENEYLN